MTDGAVDTRIEEWARYFSDECGDLEVEFFSGGRGMVVQVSGDGETIVRDYGGPLYSFGSIRNRRLEELRAWRSRDPERFARIAAWLVEAEFPVAVKRFNLVADERPSTIRVRHSNGAQASMMIVHRQARAVPALGELERELSHLCYEESEKPSTETVANPELVAWEGIDDGLPRPG